MGRCMYEWSSRERSGLETDSWERSVDRGTLSTTSDWMRPPVGGEEPRGALAFTELEEEMNPRKEPEKEWLGEKKENQESVVS